MVSVTQNKKLKTKWRQIQSLALRGYEAKKFNKLLLNVHYCFPEFTNRNMGEVNCSFRKFISCVE
jgi:hypothetical protein